MNIYNFIAVTITRPPTLPIVSTRQSDITRIINVILAIFGAIAVIVIAFGGFKYVSSRGDPQAIAKAKDTILYAAIGLVVSLMGQAIIAFGFNRVIN